MRKYLFFIVCAICFCACKPTPEQLVKRFILDKAIDPSSVRVLYHSEVLRQERTKQDTLYHLISIDSICACSDSIRIETRHFPEHYYCYWTIEGNDSSAQPSRCNIELAVMTDGDVMFYDKYGKLYYGSTSSETRALLDTFTNINWPNLYSSPGVWAIRKALLK